MHDVRRSVLLVEDDPNDVLLVQRAFRKAGVVASMSVVNDGQAALDYLNGRGVYADRGVYPLPALMLLDLKLPRKSGHEVLEWMRAQPALKRVPVVMLTSSKESADINRAYDLGANSYLVKPVAFNDLLSLVKTLDLYWLMLNESPALH
ncbi:MAG: response regulator [Gammaproteobacteria bacterium]|nr:response regulator [Gammaproteobacteria bacterium]